VTLPAPLHLDICPRKGGLKLTFLLRRVSSSPLAAYSAVQFTTYETLKSVFTDYEDREAGGKGKGKLGTGLKLVAGSLAGITSVRFSFFLLPP